VGILYGMIMVMNMIFCLQLYASSVAILLGGSVKIAFLILMSPSLNVPSLSAVTLKWYFTCTFISPYFRVSSCPITLFSATTEVAYSGSEIWETVQDQSEDHSRS